MESAMMVGVSPAIDNIRLDIAQAARCDAKVLITGESGSGKEIVAKLIHATSRRSQAPLVTVNCAALTDTLLETELFGHVRGSFTGAYRDRAGAFEMADRGTVFLDEVGEMTPRMQGLLLRFLETGEIQRVGSDRRQTRVDVRIIAATNRVLLESVETKKFREDLYYRLNVIHLAVPPLRERPEDIPVLFDHFLQLFSRQYRAPVPELTNDVRELLLRHSWPGNVRELKNMAERMIVHPPQKSTGMVDPRLQAISPKPPAPEGHSARPSVAEEKWEALTRGRESFWSVVYAPFMSRDLTRDDVRALVRMGLENTAGNYKILVELFNMRPDDYKRFLGFLRKYHCHVPFQQFRCANSSASRPPARVPVSA